MFKFEIGQVVYIQDGDKIKRGKIIGRMLKECPHASPQISMHLANIHEVGNKLGISKHSYEIQYDENYSTTQPPENIFTTWEEFQTKYHSEFSKVTGPEYVTLNCPCGRRVIMTSGHAFCGRCQKGL